jgi:hypothetical protein
MSLETTVLIPAGMKPMHGGHLHLIREYANHPDVKEVRVIIGPAGREKIDQELAVSIAEYLTKDMHNVTIIETNYPTPVTSLYKYMETVECGNYAVGAAYKSNDYKTVLKFVENFNKGGKYENAIPDCVHAIELNIDFNPILYKGRNDEFEGIPMSATVVRKDIDNEDLTSFLTSYPNTPFEQVVMVWNMIMAKTSKSTNLHMQHIEDLIFNNGIAGIIKCKGLMEKTLNTLNKKRNQVQISTKYDGAPAVFCWSSFPGLPNNGIAIKGLFNKNPETFCFISDITNSGKPLDLQRKLIKLLEYLPDLKIPDGEIWQGDIMYDDESITIEDINGYPALSFHPNTICYSAKSMQDYIRIKNSKLGMVWHTIYYGESLDNVKCRYNINVGSLGHVPDIYMIDHIIPYENLTQLDLSYTDDVSYINELLHLATYEPYIALINNKIFVEYLTLFYNSMIRNNIIVGSHKFVGKLKEFVKNRFDLIIESKKTQKTQIQYETKCNEILDIIEENRYVITYMHRVMLKITGLKIAFINELDRYSTFYTHFKMLNGKFNETNNEGYAISDGFNIVKLINRHEFSSSNFSDDIVKGWSK